MSRRATHLLHPENVREQSITSEKNSQEHQRRTVNNIKEEQSRTSEKNSQEHQRRTVKNIKEEQSKTSEKNSQEHQTTERRTVKNISQSLRTSKLSPVETKGENKNLYTNKELKNKIKKEKK